MHFLRLYLGATSLESIPITLQALILLLGLIGVAVGADRYYQAKIDALRITLESLKLKDESIRGELHLIRTEIENVRDWAELSINGCNESIQHARSRFRDDGKQYRAEMLAQLQDIKTYLSSEARNTRPYYERQNDKYGFTETKSED